MAHMMEKTNVHKVLLGIAGCKWPIGRPRYRLGDNVNIDLKQDGRVGCNSSSLAQVDKW